MFRRFAFILLLLGGVVPVAVAVDLIATRVGVGFSNPVFATAPAGVPDRLYVLEQNTGRIRVFVPSTGEILADPFLTVPAGDLSTGGERGLLGMAFHPDYDSNGRFFLNFTGSDGRTVIREYTVSADPDRADPSSGRTLLEIAQPFSNHNGGWIGFGPDGMLYIATGDGGSGNDPGNRAQDTTDQLLGKILRIDPGDVADGAYAIPQDNPFVDLPGDDEIWAYGLRNPWRCAFDRVTGDLWIADVGQGAREEINFQPAGAGGRNYGWRVMEGNRSTGLGGGPPPFDPSFTAPIHDYDHGIGLSITGGYVYRGQGHPEMDGLYFFADYVFATIWTLERGLDETVTVVDRTEELKPDAGSIGSIVSFAEDALGELYIIDHDGEIFRIGAADSALRNLSTRAGLGATSEVAIAGFVLEGGGSSDVLIRGIGPGLAQFQVADPIEDPGFEIYQDAGGGSQLVFSNENWEDNDGTTAVRAAEAATGAFSLSAGSADSALVASLGEGSYTEVLSGKTGDAGIGLLEVYLVEPDGGGPGSAPLLRNISTRAAVEAGSGALIAGFVLEGTGSRRFLIRGIGAGLTDFGVTGVITDPVVEVFELGSASPLATNDDWDEGSNGTEVSTAAESAGAFPLDFGSGDAALVLRLPPGAYTARVSSGGGESGVALVEIYLLP